MTDQRSRRTFTGRTITMPDMLETDKAAGDANGQRSGRGRGDAGRPAPDWRPFLRAMAEELDMVAGAAGRDALLHGVGRQMALQHPLSHQGSTAALALEMNELLEDFGWGGVRITFSAAEACLVLIHRGLPRIGGRGEPPGTWLAGVLEGLYEGWLGQQPGADASLVARRVPTPDAETVAIRYGKA
ncbi:cellulose synthase [Acidisoma cellulosilytica]|uniref:Cellulose synthase n=1 Tax=Acidisoma cellulosilyticum TaxID=2802395 RepID=A0A963Z6M1_9PROT|nr:cellulose biosynthesis protein BcsD [Acidisoma cellulosilyticum]MCB8883466.1 cellulose synthase [Acidisoma cellulosilyticum]